MGDFSDFQRGQIVGAHLAGTSVMKQSLLGVSKASVMKQSLLGVSKAAVSIHKSWEDIIS